jgi:hypothetical protein
MYAMTIAAAALLVLQPAAAKPAPQKPQPKPAAAAAKTAPTDLPVTISYKGKGAVDVNHKLIVWLFAEPNITAGSRPITHQIATKNNETLTFKDVTTSPVYLFAVYDTTGTYDAVSGPPPAGVPAAPYRKAATGPALAVKPGAPIKFTLTDAERWK